jgi:hypothetical protein
MRTRRRRTQNQWTRNVNVAPRAGNGLPTPPPKIPEPARRSRDAIHLGPYESSYEITRGYSLERAIVTP